MIRPGDIITNAELADEFGVGNMGGMRRSLKSNLLILISDHTKGLYQDRWEGDILHYTGMGKVGDQTFSAQNKTLRDADDIGVEVHLFEVFTPKNYIYVGQVGLSDSPYQEDQVDDNGLLRKVWMFPLRIQEGGEKPLPTSSELESVSQKSRKQLQKKSLEELKELASTAHRTPSKRQATGAQYIRDEAVAVYVKQAANGFCDLCNNEAPFTDKAGRPFLENHHVIPLAEGGDDTISNAVALCPNCHRKMHSLKRKADISKLQRRVKERDQ